MRAEQWAHDPAFVVAAHQATEDRVAVLADVNVEGVRADLYMITAFHWSGRWTFYNLHRAVCFGHIHVAPIVAPPEAVFADPAEYRDTLYRKLSQKMREALG